MRSSGVGAFFNNVGSGAFCADGATTASKRGGRSKAATHGDNESPPHSARASYG